ncbi:hypothetical protein KOW79_005521 [Hemibagrus wyckioides]|uniref:Uncharacterized protein n=1 Tax=Hemibagrus wyckioides TaxID=337641 RepID=A0A9D3SPC9_9TELE|nr:uncharacterized protein si:ch211-167j6.3 [Hemibagrus wyckioides]KAG7331552.1 hypothetical protein KOW79_005521 [Hemibagrus wyckioides]
MDSPQDNTHNSSQNDKAVHDLLKQLKDATSKLQRVKAESEDVRMEVQQWREEMDRRMLLLLHVDDRVCDALMELEAVKQEKRTLIQLIETLNTRAREMKLSSISVSVMHKQVEALEEEEHKLKAQCEHVKKVLDCVQEKL